MACFRTVGDLLAADDRAVLHAVQVGEQGAVGGVDLSWSGPERPDCWSSREGMSSSTAATVRRPRLRTTARMPARDERDGDEHRDQDDDASPADRLVCARAACRDAASFSTDLHATPRVAAADALCRRLAGASHSADVLYRTARFRSGVHGASGRRGSTVPERTHGARNQTSCLQTLTASDSDFILRTC